MNKMQFLNDLSRRLRGLPKEDYDDAMNYYTEYFMDAEVDDEADVIPMVGKPEEVARKILDDALVQQIEPERSGSDEGVGYKGKEKSKKSVRKIVWLTVLSIFAAPIALPLAIAAAALVFSLAIAAFSVVFAIGASFVALLISGIVIIPGIFWAGNIAQGILILGISLVAVAISLLLFVATKDLTAKLFGSIAKICHKRFKSSEEKRA